MLKKLKKVLTQLKSLCLTDKPENLPNGLYCFNYHRIGDKDFCQYDGGVFSATAKEFEEQLIYFKTHFTVITQTEAYHLISSQNITDRYLIITFDDAYIDNYTIAYPLLLKHSLNACFFVPTSFIEGDIIPWWDQIAYIIKATTKKSFTVPFGAYSEIKIKNMDVAIRQALKEFKSCKTLSTSDKLSLLKASTNFKGDIPLDNMFMSWRMLREMSENGMDIGSHTCKHNILSHLSAETQKLELIQSKSLIEKNIGSQVIAVAYPVGKKDTYSSETLSSAIQAGYMLGYNFEKGINLVIENRFEINRFSIEVGATPERITKHIHDYLKHDKVA